MEKIIQFTPAWDKTGPGPAKNYGIGSVRIGFFLKGELGATQFKMSTNWLLPHNQKGRDQFEMARIQLATIRLTEGEELKAHSQSGNLPEDTLKYLEKAEDAMNMLTSEDFCLKYPFESFKPQPSDLGYHSPKPMYKGQKPMAGECEWTNGKPCYYDGSELRAKEVYDILVEKGSEGVWEKLEEEYVLQFGELK